jgi:DNA-binding NarL/FixJ family response regulator
VSESGRSALLVARQPAQRRAIALALERHGVSVVGEIARPEEALPILEQYGPSLLVIELSAATGDADVTLRNEQVLELVRAARDRVPGLRVIAVTDSLDAGAFADAIGNRVDAYLLGSDAE